jgi:hypothetical protein
VLISISISFLILSFIILDYQYEIQNGELVSKYNRPIPEKEFFSQQFNLDVKQIFILGSSQVVSINSTHIKNSLLENNYEYEVFNLAKISDVPSDRLKTLDMIISAKPEIVIYGISDRDFVEHDDYDKMNTVLPSPHYYFSLGYTMFKNSLDFDISLFETPQRVTLSYIIDFLSSTENKSAAFEQENTPFMKVTESITFVDDDIGFMRTGYQKIPHPNENINYIALKEIIQKLQNNDISVVLFITPQSEFYLNFMPESQIDSFNLILNKLYEMQNLKVFNLYDKYADLDIWADLSHIAINKDTIIYTDDIFEMILKEIES